MKLVLCIIRARFRSSDLWVMGPPRFRCATLMLVLQIFGPKLISRKKFHKIPFHALYQEKTLLEMSMDILATVYATEVSDQKSSIHDV
jgi:hypothetical protein